MHARELLLGVTPEHQREVRLWEKRNKWGGWKVYGGHALGEIFPPEKFAKTHPDYYALVKGKRDVPGPDYDYKHRGQVCTTNPGVIEAAAEWVNKFYDAHPDYQAVHITMNDSGGFCECDRCRALDSGSTMKRGGIDAEETKGGPARNTVMTDRIYTFVNQVSERVQKKHPGKYVVSMAYARYILPPEKIRLHPTSIPQYCLWGAYRHANAELKREHETIAAGWAKAARMAGIYEYYINGSWPGLHRLVVPYIAESIRFLKQQGIRLYQTQSGDEFGTNGVNYYVAGKLLVERLSGRARNPGRLLREGVRPRGAGRSAFPRAPGKSLGGRHARRPRRELQFARKYAPAGVVHPGVDEGRRRGPGRGHRRGRKRDHPQAGRVLSPGAAVYRTHGGRGAGGEGRRRKPR